MRYRVAVSLEKTLNDVSHFGAKQFIRCGGSAWRKSFKQSSFCVEVVWQTQSTVQHLAQTKKKYILLIVTEFHYVHLPQMGTILFFKIKIVIWSCSLSTRYFNDLILILKIKITFIFKCRVG